MNPLQLPRFIVTEVHNYGGFFGGDTVTLSGHQVGAAEDDETTLVIDEKALENVSGRHKIVPGMLLALKLDGERVDHAWVLAAATHEELRSALGPVILQGPQEGPRVVSRRCPQCGRWVASEFSIDDCCLACDAPLKA